LIDDAHISDLTVSKITAGTITAAWLIAGSIKTATAGPRTEMDGNGLSIYDDSGAKIVDLGLLDDGTNGAALINDSGQLTKLRDFVFGPQTGQVLTTENCSSGSPVDLATFGPAVNVMVGATGRVLILCSARVFNQASAGLSSAAGGSLYLIYDGANTGAFYGIAQQSHNSLVSAGTIRDTVNAVAAGSLFLTGLNPGLTRFYLQYSIDSGTGQWSNRLLTAFPY
jgi:hypothetical protein